MAEVGSSYVTILPSAKGFGRKLDSQVGPDMDRSGKDAGGKFGKAFGLAAGAIGGAATIGLLKNAVGQASDLAESGTKIVAIFGKDGSAAVQKFAAGGAKALGQTKLAVLDSAATFGTFGKAAGLTGKDLAKFSTGFAGLSTDLASFFNTDPSQATEAIGAALRGEAEPIRQFGVLLDDATLRTRALKLGLIKTTKQALTPQQKVLAAQAEIYRQTKDAQGDFQRTSGGLANQQRILKASLTDSSAELGTRLLPAVTRVVTFLNEKGLPAFQQFSTRVRNFLVPVVQSVVHFSQRAVQAFRVLFEGSRDATDGFAELFDNGLGNAGKFVGPLRKIGETILAIRDGLVVAGPKAVAFAKSLRSRLQPIFESVANTIVTKVIPAVQAVGAYLGEKIPPIIAGVVGVVKALLPVIESLATFFYTKVYPAIVSVGIAIGRSLKPVLDALIEGIRTKLLPTLTNLVNKFHEWQPTLERVGAVILTVVGFVLKLAAVILGKVLPPLISFAFALQSKIIGAVVAVIGWVVKLIGWLFDFGVAFGKATAATVAFVTGVGEKVAEAVAFFVGIPQSILDAVGDLSTLLYDVGISIIQGLLDGIGKKAEEIGGFLKEHVTDIIPGGVKDLLGIHSPSKVMMPLGANVVQGLIVGIEGQRSALNGSLGGLTSGLASKVSLGGVATAGSRTQTPGIGGQTGPLVNIESLSPQNWNEFMRDTQMRARQSASDGLQRVP